MVRCTCINQNLTIGDYDLLIMTSLFLVQFKIRWFVIILLDKGRIFGKIVCTEFNPSQSIYYFPIE